MSTINQHTRDTLLKVIQEHIDKESGWAHLGEVGSGLKKQGIRYGKLLPYLRNFMHLVELKKDYSHPITIVYIRQRSEKPAQ